MIQILHNPRCKKSREGLSFLKEKGIEPEKIRYLDNQLTKNQIRDLIKKMNIKPEDWVRKNEDIYKQNYKNRDLTDEEWIDILFTHPKLLERPVVINGDKAVIARPVEKISEIL
ncbi:arsenate reductase (glutaredoxin) [Natronoflexus pectinivorans]|uniref:Arsenate reductase n=1 Tax=Natronoflexus pectinivorans TaxID=682526 RepID=A0A4V2RWZ1_9BACT|nr:arsenate reductase (glutaredoxin) [Natronoflexus pectinivorans]TCO10721.1 arsenate reductase [Natronoflexus pectinivorans]